LTALLRRRHVDAGIAQFLEMLFPIRRPEHMIGALSALETVEHKRQDRRVLFLRRSEKCTYVPIFGQYGTGKGNRRRGRFHDVFLRARSNDLPHQTRGQRG
jgi:hypothetical protein